jgi:hypothetical protein
VEPIDLLFELGDLLLSLGQRSRHPEAMPAHWIANSVGNHRKP